MFHQFIVEPRVKRSACDRCGICLKDCAPGAICYDDKKYPEIDYAKCIYCYCCEEYCPRKAVYLHGSSVNYLMRGIRRVLNI
jgi:MinD superfamily P-loop ATPase